MRPWLVLALLASCGPIDALVASVPDAGGRDPRGAPCDTSQQCPPDAFCERPSCGAPAGRCTRRPMRCEPLEQVQCGCNGVTYFNECLRRAAGASFEATGECASGVTCDSRACPDAAFCARVGGSCGSTTGRCWVTPPSCPGPGFVTCAPGGACLDFCAAVRSEQPFVPAGHACQ